MRQGINHSAIKGCRQSRPMLLVGLAVFFMVVSLALVGLTMLIGKSRGPTTR